MTTPSRLPLLVALGSLVVAGLLAAALWWYIRRRRAGSIPVRLQRVTEDLLSGVLIPHLEGGQIHLEYLLLTRQGIVVMDLRDVVGHVFGSDSMQEWTVLDRSRRATFANPLPPLYDRVAAVSRLVPDVPVRGVVAFTAAARFSKGFPPDVTTLDALLEELARSRESGDELPGDVLGTAWERLRREVVSREN